MEDFWQWPAPTIAGTETIDLEEFVIIDLRQPDPPAGGCARVRVWIAPARLLPLRIEKYDESDRLVRRFLFRKPIQRDGLWVPTVTVVQPPGSTRETVIELSRGARDVAIFLSEFTPAAIQEFAARATLEAEAEARVRRGGK